MTIQVKTAAPYSCALQFSLGGLDFSFKGKEVRYKSLSANIIAAAYDNGIVVFVPAIINGGYPKQPDSMLCTGAQDVYAFDCDSTARLIALAYKNGLIDIWRRDPYSRCYMRERVSMRAHLCSKEPDSPVLRWAGEDTLVFLNQQNEHKKLVRSHWPFCHPKWVAH